MRYAKQSLRAPTMAVVAIALVLATAAPAAAQPAAGGKAPALHVQALAWLTSFVDQALGHFDQLLAAPSGYLIGTKDLSLAPAGGAAGVDPDGDPTVSAEGGGGLDPNG